MGGHGGSRQPRGSPVWDTLPTVIGDVLVTVSASIWTLPGLWALDPDIGGTVVWIFRRRTSTTATPSRSSPPSVRQYYDQARGTAELRRPKPYRPACPAFRDTAFRVVDRHGRRSTTRLNERTIARMIKWRAQNVGVAGDFAGHSLRAGFATEAYAHGTPELAIMRHGRWRSARWRAATSKKAACGPTTPPNDGCDQNTAERGREPASPLVEANQSLADVSSAAWSWSRRMRRTVAGEGCWPFFLPLVMTSRAAMSRRLRF
jgi:hypothetical protein